jgi:hypothetical protein
MAHAPHDPRPGGRMIDSDDDSDDDTEMTLCDLCSTEYPLDESAPCERCDLECCPNCRVRGVCSECREEATDGPRSP